MIDSISPNTIHDKIDKIIQDYQETNVPSFNDMIGSVGLLVSMITNPLNEATAGQVLTADGDGGSEWIDPNDLTIQVIEFSEDDWDEENEQYVKEIPNLKNNVLYKIIPLPNAQHQTQQGQSMYEIQSPKLYGFVQGSNSRIDGFSSGYAKFLLYNMDDGPIIKVGEGILFEVITEL